MRENVYGYRCHIHLTRVETSHVCCTNEGNNVYYTMYVHRHRETDTDTNTGTNTGTNTSTKTGTKICTKTYTNPDTERTVTRYRWKAKVGAHEVLAEALELLDGPQDGVLLWYVFHCADRRLSNTA